MSLGWESSQLKPEGPEGLAPAKRVKELGFPLEGAACAKIWRRETAESTFSVVLKHKCALGLLGRLMKVLTANAPHLIAPHTWGHQFSSLGPHPESHCATEEPVV